MLFFSNELLAYRILLMSVTFWKGEKIIKITPHEGIILLQRNKSKFPNFHCYLLRRKWIPVITLVSNMLLRLENESKGGKYLYGRTWRINKVLKILIWLKLGGNFRLHSHHPFGLTFAIFNLFGKTPDSIELFMRYQLFCNKIKPMFDNYCRNIIDACWRRDREFIDMEE